MFAEVRNVWIVNKASLVTYRGPTMLATTLHAMSMLLRSAEWDWFINLSASDYPLLTQDGMVSGPFYFLLHYKLYIYLYIYKDCRYLFI